MAIQWVENFNWAETSTISQGGWSSETGGAGGASVVAAVSGMFNRCIRVRVYPTELSELAVRGMSTTFDRGLISFAVATDSVATQGTSRFFMARSSGTSQLGIRRELNNALSVVRSTTVLATTSSPVLTRPFARYRIELGFVIHGTTGSYDLRVDGQSLLSATGVNTRHTTDTINQFVFGSHNMLLNTSAYAHYSDILFDSDETAFRGDWRGLSLYPTADATGYSTPSTGSNRWAVMDESPIASATYNTFPGVGEDVYDMADTGLSSATIHGLALLYNANKTDTNPCEFRGRVKSGSDYGAGTTQGLNTSRLMYQDIFELDPQGGAAWTPARVDAVQTTASRLS